MWVSGTSSDAPGGPTFFVDGTIARALPGCDPGWPLGAAADALPCA